MRGNRVGKNIYNIENEVGSLKSSSLKNLEWVIKFLSNLPYEGLKNVHFLCDGVKRISSPERGI